VIIVGYNCTTGTLTYCWRHAAHNDSPSPSLANSLTSATPNNIFAADPWGPHAGEVDRSRANIQSIACQQLPCGILGICPPMGGWGQAAGAGVLCRHHLDLHCSHLMHSPDTPKIGLFVVSMKPSKKKEACTLLRCKYFRCQGSAPPGALMSMCRKGVWLITVRRVVRRASTECTTLRVHNANWWYCNTGIRLYCF